MKILVTTPYFYPHVGGSELYIENLYRALVKKYPAVKVDILTYDIPQSKKFEKYKNLNIYRIGAWEILKGQFSLPNYLELITLLKKLKKNHHEAGSRLGGDNYDFVNAHTRFFDNAWWSSLAAKYLGAKSILTDHCAFHPKHKNPIVSFLTLLLDLILIPSLNIFYDYKLVVSRATQKFLKKYGMKNTQVFYATLNLDDFKTDKKDNSKIIISFVGRMIEAKGVRLLLKVAQSLVSKYKNVEFIFAGAGDLYEQLKSEESSQIKFLGQVSQDEVKKLLKKTNIFVLPSSHHEGLPVSLLEAGAASCAVLSSNAGGISEVIEDGKSGLFVEAQEKDLSLKLELLIKDSKLRLKLAKNLNIRIKEKFNLEKIVADYFNFLQKAK